MQTTYFYTNRNSFKQNFTRYLKVEDVKKISKESGNLHGSKIYINDTPNIMYEEFELAADLMVNKLGVELIIIDSYEYLQEIVQSDDEDIFGLHSTILNKYKEKARELNIPIIVLMELPVRNEDEPSIADFRKKIRNGIYRGVYSCFGNYLS